MRPLHTAEIIAVGSELLTPFRTDSNSLFLTARLNERGIDVRAKTIVGDHRIELAAVLSQSLARVDLVLLTGGLGPTDDDITREAVAGVLGRALHHDAGTLARIAERFAKRGLHMAAINQRQAQVIDGAEILPNTLGTAPGLWLEHGDQVVVLFPGPPRELEPMFDALVAPKIESRTAGSRLRRRVIKISGPPESHVDEIAQPIYGTFRHWPIPIETTILASPGQIELHLSARGSDIAAVDRALEQGVAALTPALAPAVFSVDGRGLEQVVGDLLRARRARIAVAESCTGGMVLSRLTDVAGSSEYVVGGITAYANDVKVQQLGVPVALITEHGAVSEPVAQAMADGVRQHLKAEVGVAVTGIAGPSGGSDDKPVGTVVIAAAADERTVRTFRFAGGRAMVRQQATQAALDMVRRLIS